MTSPTPDQIAKLRVRMAELDGYSDFGEMDVGLGPCLTAMYHPSQTEMSILCVPNYPEDLNAVHELEKKLTKEQQFTYGKLLMSMMPKEILAPREWFYVAHATALQRCIAIDQTLSKDPIL